MGGYDGNLSFGIDAYGYDAGSWEDNDPIYIDADTGKTSGEAFRICKVANSYA
jgi:hypothetical protein